MPLQNTAEAVETGAGQQPSSRTRWASLLPANRSQRFVGVLALMFLAGCFGYFVGYRDGDPDSPSGDSADVGFLYDMSTHHYQAVQLAMIELAKGSEPSVQVFAREIIRSQSYEIGLMKMRLGNWGFDPAQPTQGSMAWMGMSLASTDVMPGMADEAEVEALRNAEGRRVDELFLALMSDHHAGGVAMAESAAASADDDWVIDTATRMARIQATEIVELGIARKAAGLDPAPSGFVADFGPNANMDDMEMGSTDDDDGG